MVDHSSLDYCHTNKFGSFLFHCKIAVRKAAQGIRNPVINVILFTKYSVLRIVCLLLALKCGCLHSPREIDIQYFGTRISHVHIFAG